MAASIAMPPPTYPQRPPRLSRDEAEMVAIRVLTFLTEEEDRLRRFLKISGLDPATIRAAASSPAFHLGVLDYLASDEGLSRAFALKTSTHPQTVTAAREAISPRMRAVDPAKPASTAIAIHCEHCDTTELRSRRLVPQAPPRAVRVIVARCGSCGGGFDQPEAWLDAAGREIDPSLCH